MTRYILHGGQTGLDCANNDNFFAGIAKNGTRILLCYFARSEDSWQDLAAEDMARIQDKALDKEIEFMIADMDDFTRQVEWADSLYFRGGDGRLIRDVLINAGLTKEMLAGKTVAGSSAGANVFSRYYHDQDYPAKIEEGLGFLPIKSITHYGQDSKYPADYEKIKQELKDYQEDLEIITLPETEFVIKEIN